MSLDCVSRRKFVRAVAVTGFLLSVSLLALASWGDSWGDPDGTGSVQAQDNGCSGSSVCNPTVEPSTRSPSARAHYEVKFRTPRDLDLRSYSIVLVLHEDIGVPGDIDSSFVRVQFVGSPRNGRWSEPTVEVDVEENPRRPATLTISPPIARAEDGAQIQSINADAEIIVYIDRRAGITNPAEGGAYPWSVGTVHDGEATAPVAAQHPDVRVREAFARVEDVAEHAEGQEHDAVGLLVDWEVRLSETDVGRAEVVTATGRGYRSGTTLTFWRDANFNGVRDSGEAQLCQVLVAANGIGVCTFAPDIPPFARGHGVCDTSGESSTNGNIVRPAETADCNFINGVDGVGHSSMLVKTQEIADSNTFAGLERVLDLHGQVIAEAIGRRLFIRLVDIPPGHLVDADLGGVPLDLKEVANSRVPDNGSLSFSVDFPGRTRQGHQSLRVVFSHDGTSPQSAEHHHEVSTTLWVDPHADLTVYPERVLPNQRIRLYGRGFIVEDGRGEIASVSIGGHSLDRSLINSGKDAPLALDRNGNWSGYVDLPVNNATTTPGVQTIRVMDVHGRKGLAEVTIPPRTLEVRPSRGRPGSIVAITGQGFPARNDHRSGINLRIYYESGVGKAVASAETDALGNFSGEIRIPINTPAPSSNTIRVEFEDEAGSSVVATASHEVPTAAVTVSPEAGPPGATVSLHGQGFRKFSRVSSVRLGAFDLSPGGTVTTDANGDFSLTFLAPGVGAGLHTVVVTVAGVTASVSFDISLSGVSTGAPVPVAQAFEALGDSFATSFHFNNDTKAWTYFDPELAEKENTQRFVLTGETYLVQVRETVEVILNGKTRLLTCRQGNCWNQLVW